jgi:NAD(P)H-nitrite reductase large subunit
MKVVIIGNHAAGLSAAQTLREGDESCSITVISKENVPPYSRCLIPYLVSGEKGLKDILFRPQDFYEKNSIKTMLGTEAIRVFPKENKVLLADDHRVEYDFLIIATGGTVSFPALSGIKAKGVFGFRTLGDAQKIIDYLEYVETAAVLGGGPIGIKAAFALRKRGKKVKVLVSSPSILSQIVGDDEAKILEEYLTELGIQIITRASPAKILGTKRVEGIETTEGRKIDCQMVIVGKGVTANKDLARGTEIKTEYGIIVDEHCRTNIHNIYAAGDVTQSQDTVKRKMDERTVAARCRGGKGSRRKYKG